MTLLNLNHFLAQAELSMSTRYICKSKCHVCYHFLDIFENPMGKFLLTCSV